MSYGILTVCPSGAAFAIPLGPTNPQLITSAAETSVFRRAGFSPALRLLVPTFSLPNAPAWVTPLPSSRIGTLSYRATRITLCAMLKNQVMKMKESSPKTFDFFLLTFNSSITHSVMRTTPSVSVLCLAPIIFGARTLDE